MAEQELEPRQSDPSVLAPEHCDVPFSCLVSKSTVNCIGVLDSIRGSSIGTRQLVGLHSVDNHPFLARSPYYIILSFHCNTCVA